ncbi:MAG: CoA-binding protein [Promethearchaeota archaeon]
MVSTTKKKTESLAGTYTDFEPLFYPKTMAVIGASRNPVGAVKYVKAHKDTPICVYPVNKNLELDELEGLKVYHSIFEIDDDIDLAIIGVPKEAVPSVIRDFKKKVVKFAVIFTSGFIESGNDDLEQELRDAIREVPTRFIGPNCLGIYHPKGNLVYFPGYPASDEFAGNIAFISQSGGHTAKTNTLVMSRGGYFSKTISIGNSVDLKPQDFIMYFKDDPDTDVIGLYLESTGDGRGLMDALKMTTREKPVVIWKGGSGDVGTLATASHTGNLGGNYRIWVAACKQTGTILADDFETFTDLLLMFSFKLPLPKSLNIAVVACGGGNAVESADVFESLGFKLPALKPETQEKIYKFIPDVNTALRNPVDLGEYGYVPSNFTKALEIIAEDENIDSIVYVKESARFQHFSVNFLMKYEDYEREMVRKLKRVHDHVAKCRNIPMYLNDPYIEESNEAFASRVSFQEQLIKKGILVFGRINVLAKSIKKAHEYYQYLEKHGSLPD